MAEGLGRGGGIFKQHHFGYLYFISAAFVCDTEIFVVSCWGGGNVRCGFYTRVSVHTCAPV